MKIFLDFDDCLFDTKTFIENFRGVFAACGIPEEVQVSTAVVMKDGTVGGWYDPERHIALLAETCVFDHAQLRTKIEAFLSDTERFLFPEVTDFLSLMTKCGHTLYILSYGDDNFQVKKIRGTGIDHFFEKIVVTREDKALAMGSELGSGSDDVWFIEDRTGYIASVKKMWPHMRMVLLRRKEGRYYESDVPDGSCDFVAANLAEAAGAIEGFVHSTGV